MQSQSWNGLWSAFHQATRWDRRVPHCRRTGRTKMNGKVCIIGGGGVRTPLLIHGLLQAQQVLKSSEIVLFDVSHERAEIMAALGREIADKFGVEILLSTTTS